MRLAKSPELSWHAVTMGVIPEPWRKPWEGIFPSLLPEHELRTSLDWKLKPGQGREHPDGAFSLEEATNPGPCTHLSARWCLPVPASPGQHWRKEKKKILFKNLLLPVWFWQTFLCRGSHNSGPGPVLAGSPLSGLVGHIYFPPAPWEHHLSLSPSWSAPCKSKRCQSEGRKGIRRQLQDTLHQLLCQELTATLHSCQVPCVGLSGEHKWPRHVSKQQNSLGTFGNEN